MADPRSIALDAICTDGWFERIGESVGSFEALCEIVGERFFAFSMITGARITALTVDRRDPDHTIVDFVVGTPEGQPAPGDVQRLTLADFRRRLVGALVGPEPTGPAPERVTDTEAVQLHIGVRYLLLAPLYGYRLQELRLGSRGSEIVVLHDGVEEVFPLEQLRERIRGHVREELDRVARRSGRGAIDLSKVVEAEEAASRGEHQKIIELLGPWPAPLALFLRTPEGQLLNEETRGIIARGLGLLGEACVALDDVPQGEEVLRLAVQYAGDGAAASDIYRRLGEALVQDDRPGEAIGPLRRAANLGAPGDRIWPLLARALANRGRHLAAFGALLEARAAGAEGEAFDELMAEVEERLGPALERWRELVEGRAAAVRAGEAEKGSAVGPCSH